METNKRIINVVLVFAGLLLGGCAVVTVDVDVYKGPLANHIDVQREQAAVTALAAKPLLVHLRLDLERYARFPVFGHSRRDNDVLGTLFESVDYIPTTKLTDPDKGVRTNVLSDARLASIAPGNGIGQSNKADAPIQLKSAQAGFVNRILAEYDSPEELHLLQQFAGQAAPGGTTDEQLSQLRRDAEAIAALDTRRVRARGRVGPGLETLTFLYESRKTLYEQGWSKSHPSLAPQPQYVPEEGELFDALIHFSQQVLFSANNDILFPQQGRGIAKATSAFVQAQTSGGEDLSTSTQSYVRVLQAIGNSILVDLDELREQAQHDQDSQVAKPSEQVAVRIAWDRDPWQVLQSLSDSIGGRIDDLQSEINTRQCPPAQHAAAAPASTQPATEHACTTTVPSTRPSCDELIARRDTLVKALEVIQKESKAILTDSFPATRPAPGIVFDRLVRRLKDRLEGTTEGSPEANAINEAICDVKGNPSGVSAIDAVDGSAKDAKAVMDGVIAALREEKIQAIHDEGKDSHRVQQIEQAIVEAEAQRADMLYIRPASAYLRTSFPATSLQRDARLGFHNMIAEHMSHQIPLADLLANGADYRTLLELDKQYWQNINTVRVVGGGNTNYVIAKDDIGNWYVKNYSADPKDIIKSAQSLALFSLGPTIGAGSDLLLNAAKLNAAAAVTSGDAGKTQDALESLDETRKQVKQADAASPANAGTGTGGNATGNIDAGSNGSGSTAQQTSAQNTPANNSILLSELQNSQKTYADKTATDLTSVQNDMKGLKDKIDALWQGDPTVKASAQLSAYETALTTNATQYLTPSKPVVDASKPASSPATNAPDGQQIINDLQAMRRFHKALETALAPAEGASAADKAAATQASKIVTTNVKELLDKYIPGRQQVTKEYQTALTLIGQAAGQ